MIRKKVLLLVFVAVGRIAVFGQDKNLLAPREHLLFDFDWRFAFGHPYDTQKDFNNGTGYFSYFAKTGYGDGAAAPNFNDSTWRKLDLPHDWAVEQEFSPKGSPSHGFKAIGRNFPDASVGWYRKKFFVPASDLGRHITIAFDGVFRNSIVWVNGHYLGTEISGYNSFEYNISEYLNYGGDNVIAVRVDATMEEGWFYEGAGIYRHVWLNKTAPLHIATNGTFITNHVNGTTAHETALATVENDDAKAHKFNVLQTIVDESGDTVAIGHIVNNVIRPYTSLDLKMDLIISKVKLWSVDTPYLYTLITSVQEDGKTVDTYRTRFGVRTISFDANKGFFLNGKHLEITGTNNHQDHAGVGTAIPDALQDFRIKTLKSFGCNTYRCSHNPPTPELLDACDRLGMLVIDENRLMGTSSTELDNLKKMILRDRNHPSVISWSIGNEEWAIENNDVGARIATTMQNYALSIDSTRFITAAFSGGVGSGISNVVQVLGYNYIHDKNTDEHHRQYPDQYSWGTEEGATHATRGLYFTDSTTHYIAAYDAKPRRDFITLEDGWKYYAARPYLAGMCIWTGFDYRGEPTPFGWPSVISYFGMLDACGFYKDDAWYLRAWWLKTPVVHVLPHWNWPGKEGQNIRVVVYSNCDEVALFLNGRNFGKKKMQVNSHLEWQVPYHPGKLEAVGYNHDVRIAADSVITTGSPVAVALSADRTSIKTDRQDLAVIKVQVNDKDGLQVSTANNQVYFSLSGPGKIIGVGNGDNTSLEPDKYLQPDAWKRKLFNGLAQVIVQSTGEAGEIVLTATSGSLKLATIKITAAK